MGVKIHLTKRVAGPSGNWPAGTTIEVERATADALVSAQAAELVSDMAPYVSEPEVKREKATEKATDKPSGKREKATEI